MVNTQKLISIILPVLHEAGSINTVITHLRYLQQNSPVEIIAIDGDPAGSTLQAIRDNDIVRVLSGPGRARQMNCGASVARGEVLLFLHADTLLPQQALTRIEVALADTRIVAGAFDLGFDTKRSIFRITEKYAALRTRLTRIPFGDQAIFVRRAYFEKIGGYAEIPLMEDVELMSRIRKRGDRIGIIPLKVLTSPRRYEGEGILYCTVRNWALQLCYSAGVSPEKLAKWYR
jgi:rSAM/selenodomain-associated transferase 2